MRIITKDIILGLLLLTSVHAIKAAPQSREIDGFFVAGNEDYQGGDYDAAIAEYNRILHAGYAGLEVYYNLGNAYYKQGKLGLAIVNYERARKLDPENEDVNYNLDLARLAAVDKIQQLPRFFLSEWLHRVSHAMSLRLLGYLAVGLYLTLMILLILGAAWRRIRTVRGMFAALMIDGVLLAALAGMFLSRVYENETTVEAIVLAQKVDVKSAPDLSGTDVFSLHEGVKVNIRDRSLSWVKIQLADGKVGWLQMNAVEII